MAIVLTPEVTVSRLAAVVIVVSSLSCAPPLPNLGEEMPYDTLGEYALYVGEPAALDPSEGVLPFEPVAPLWSDGAGKVRHLAVPPGTAVEYAAQGPWGFPLHSAVVKTFLDQADRPVETRLLLQMEEGWEAYTYVWDAAGEEAERVDDGGTVDLDPSEAEQPFAVPTREECGWCHDRSGQAYLLAITGPQAARTVDRDGEDVDQVAWLAEQGLFGAEAPETSDVSPPLVEPMGGAGLQERARSYLHANCAHCHRDGARANDQELRFLASVDDPAALGVCRSPAAIGAGAGGLDHLIVPGAPDESILVFRMETDSPGLRMPEQFVLTPHDEGRALIRQWVQSMEAVECD